MYGGKYRSIAILGFNEHSYRRSILMFQSTHGIPAFFPTCKSLAHRVDRGRVSHSRLRPARSARPQKAGREYGASHLADQTAAALFMRCTSFSSRFLCETMTRKVQRERNPHVGSGASTPAQGRVLRLLRSGKIYIGVIHKH